MSTRLSRLGLLSLCIAALSAAACSSSSTTPAGSSGTSGTAPAEDGGDGGSSGGPVDAAPDNAVVNTGTAFTGKLGALGPVLPTVSSLMISNAGETLIYMSSAALTCDQIKTARWLPTVTADSQVIEVVIQGPPVIGDIAAPPAEINYAAGGKPSSTEKRADSGKITFTKADPTGLVEGTLTATFGADSIKGTFRADFCAGGQGF